MRIHWVEFPCIQKCVAMSFKQAESILFMFPFDIKSQRQLYLVYVKRSPILKLLTITVRIKQQEGLQTLRHVLRQ